MPPPTTEEMAWWREILAWIWAPVAGVVAATWAVAWRTRDIIAAQEALVRGQQALADAQQALALLVAELEATDRDQGRHCAGQRREILEELRREICAILTSALKDTKLEAAEERATVTTALALHTQALQAIEKDIKAIFRRLDRRHETTCVAHGRREDDHDD